MEFSEVVNTDATTSANALAYSVDNALTPVSATYYYSDFNFKFDASDNFDFVVEDASIVQSIWTMLNTSQGDRVMEPEFGIRLNRFLFENITRDLEQIIMVTLNNGFERWDPRVEVINATLLSRRGGTGNEISVQVDVKIPGILNSTRVYITQPGLT